MGMRVTLLLFGALTFDNGQSEQEEKKRKKVSLWLDHQSLFKKEFSPKHQNCSPKGRAKRTLHRGVVLSPNSHIDETFKFVAFFSGAGL